LNESATGTDGQTMLRREKHVYRYSDNSEMLLGDPDADPAALNVNKPSKLVESGLWDAIPLLTANGKKSTMPTIPLRRKMTDVIEYIPFGAVLYTRGSPRNMNHIFCAALVSLYLDELTEFLAATRSTPNTITVAMSDGYITATSDTLNPASTLTTVPKGTPMRPGCSSTETTDSASRTDAIVVCKRRVTDDPNPAIAAAGTDPELAATESLAVKIIDVGSDVYYAAGARIPLRFRGPKVQLLLTMPESDIVGDVVSGRNAAIGITCALVVVMSALIFALISALLAPLKTVADRMMAAASLDDDDADRTLSAMSEVADLQEAYYAMNDELARVRSFVPQTVLATAMKRGAVLDDDDPDMSDTASRTATSARRSRSARSSSSSVAAVPLISGLNVEASLRQVHASVLVINLRGFTEAVRHLPSIDVAQHVGTTVDLVAKAVSDSRGVLSLFHGDHMVATFNAVKSCAAHPRKAVSVALALTESLPKTGFGLVATAGVATGRCHVGNLGSTGIKAFSTIGPAFAQATVLERLTFRYTATCHQDTSNLLATTYPRVLVTDRVIAEVQHHVRFQYVDIIVLPGGVRSLIAVVTEQLAMEDPHCPKDSEWLYVVEQRASAGMSDSNAMFRRLFDMQLTEIEDQEASGATSRVLGKLMGRARQGAAASTIHSSLGDYYTCAFTAASENSRLSDASLSVRRAQPS
jgi:class 3 adenylate cyclase